MPEAIWREIRAGLLARADGPGGQTSFGHCERPQARSNLAGDPCQIADSGGVPLLHSTGGPIHLKVRVDCHAGLRPARNDRGKRPGCAARPSQWLILIVIASGRRPEAIWREIRARWLVRADGPGGQTSFGHCERPQARSNLAGDPCQIADSGGVPSPRSTGGPIHPKVRVDCRAGLRPARNDRGKRPGAAARPTQC
jgi:hypothetical protein